MKGLCECVHIDLPIQASNRAQQYVETNRKKQQLIDDVTDRRQRSRGVGLGNKGTVLLSQIVEETCQGSLPENSSLL